MAAPTRLALAGQQMTWPDENVDSVNRYLNGPKGQVELIDTSGWRPISSTSLNIDLNTEIKINISGRFGSRSFTLNLRQITASPSVFATAIKDSADPVVANTDLELTDDHVTFDKEADVQAFEVVVYYMQNRGVNTALCKPPFTAPTESASGHYGFPFQIRCIIMAQKLGATRLVELLALEVYREWLHFPLRYRHFALATHVHGALDKFIIDWIVALEYEKNEKAELARQKAFVEAVENVRSLRNFLTSYFVANPGSRSSVLKFACDVLDATKAKIEKDAQKAATENAEEETEGIADDSPEITDDIDESDDNAGDVPVNTLASVNENVAGGSANTLTTSLDEVPLVVGVTTEHIASNNDVENGVSQHVRIKINGPKLPTQDTGNETVTKVPEASLRRSTRKRAARVTFNDDIAAQEPRKKVAKMNDQGSIPQPSTEEAKIDNKGPAPTSKAPSLSAPAPKAPVPKTTASKETATKKLAPKATAPKPSTRKTKAKQTEKTKGK